MAQAQDGTDVGTQEGHEARMHCIGGNRPQFCAHPILWVKPATQWLSPFPLLCSRQKPLQPTVNVPSHLPTHFRKRSYGRHPDIPRFQCITGECQESVAGRILRGQGALECALLPNDCPTPK